MISCSYGLFKSGFLQVDTILYAKSQAIDLNQGFFKFQVDTMLYAESQAIDLQTTITESIFYTKNKIPTTHIMP